MPITYHTPEPHLAILTINRPRVLNALSLAAIAEFAAAVEQAHAHPDLRALIVTGQGDKAFCAGGDLRELAAYTTEADGEFVTQGMTTALQRLEALPCPTIAAINGLARGGGAETALACDIRIMSENADIGMTQIALGLTPGWGSGQRLLRLVGYPRALEWLATGRIIPAAQAREYGLINHLVPKGQALPAARTLAREIAAHPPETVQTLKRILRAGLTQPAEQAAAYEQAQFPALWAADEHHQRVQKFINRKRNP